MHMLRDKRSHTDQQTERFCCSTLMRAAVPPLTQISDLMAFLQNILQTAGENHKYHVCDLSIHIMQMQCE